LFVHTSKLHHLVLETSTRQTESSQNSHIITTAATKTLILKSRQDFVRSYMIIELITRFSFR